MGRIWTNPGGTIDRKPETFNFLGFTHTCGTNHQAGYFVVLRKTIGKRMAAKLKEIKAKLQRRMHEPSAGTLKWLQSVVRGYFQYHAVPGNEQRLRAFRKDVLRLWLRQLRRRSQRSHWAWERFLKRLAVQIPFARIEHPYPNVRFDASSWWCFIVGHSLPLARGLASRPASIRS